MIDSTDIYNDEKQQQEIYINYINKWNHIKYIKEFNNQNWLLLFYLLYLNASIKTCKTNYCLHIFIGLKVWQ